MNRFSQVAFAWLVAIAAVACHDKAAPAPAPTTSATAAAVSASSSAAVLIPSYADEEPKARQEITAQNYKAELDRLEKEIDQP
jgi:hypothetical protein